MILALEYNTMIVYWTIRLVSFHVFRSCAAYLDGSKPTVTLLSICEIGSTYQLYGPPWEPIQPTLSFCYDNIWFIVIPADQISGHNFIVKYLNVRYQFSSLYNSSWSDRSVAVH